MRSDRRTRIAIFGLAVLPGLSARAQDRPASQPAAESATSQVNPSINPHWKSDLCAACHIMQGTRTLAIPPADVDRICLRCHNGRSAPTEKHPVGRRIPSDDTKLPQGWPTINGQLACLTCHELSLTAGHERRGERPATAPPLGNTDFLRDFSDADPLAFCARCHVANARAARYNPHRMVNTDGQLDRQTCLFCHTRVFRNEDLLQRTGDAALKRDVISLCIGCHTQHVDWFEPGHIGALAPPRIVARMAAADRRPPGEQPTAENVESALRKHERPVRLPLAANNRVVCSTCHNPHQQGVFPESSVLAIGAFRMERLPVKKATASGPAGVASPKPPMARVPAPFSDKMQVRLGANLCSECHGK